VDERLVTGEVLAVRLEARGLVRGVGDIGDHGVEPDGEDAGKPPPQHVERTGRRRDWRADRANALHDAAGRGIGELPGELDAVAEPVVGAADNGRGASSARERGDALNSKRGTAG
jgi:hypothetical protein